MKGVIYALEKSSQLEHLLKSVFNNVLGLGACALCLLFILHVKVYVFCLTPTIFFCVLFLSVRGDIQLFVSH